MPVMNIFPDDIWNAAVAAVEDVSEEYFEDHSAIIIARAILEERNRWADRLSPPALLNRIPELSISPVSEY